MQRDCEDAGVKQDAVIFDRDGTLFQVDRRLVPAEKPDWYQFHAAAVFDSPVPHIVALTHAIKPGVAVLVVSGRSDVIRPRIQDSLHKHNVNYDRLFMRARHDQRRDDVVKADIYHREIEPYYNVLYVVDDRMMVVQMWKTKGLPVLHVSQPEHEEPFRFLGGQR